MLIVINYLLNIRKESISTHQICNLIGVPSRLMIFCLKSIPADTFIIYIYHFILILSTHLNKILMFK